MTRPLCLLFAAAIVLGSQTVSAAVVASGVGGFIIRDEIVYPGARAAAWQRLVRIQDWWASTHTYSGNSANLSLSLRPGGCWCEKLPNGGFVRHMDVVLAIPGDTLRVTGGLGPLQGIGATGALTFTLKDGAQGTTTVVAEYAVTGYSAAGMAQLAVPVDKVLAEQLASFAAPAHHGEHGTLR
jgi:hypothetical protein